MNPRYVCWLGALSLLTAPCLAQSPLRAYYDDDFILETEDGAFQLKIRGNLHFDTRVYQGENRGAPHSVDIRRARFDLQGRIHGRFTFRLQPEFAGAPYIRNAWVDMGLFPALHLRVGQMKVPFSSSWLSQDNNVNFVERGADAPIFPFFDRGLMVWGEVSKGIIVYSLGVFTGAGIDADVSSGDQDDFKDLSARLFLQPLGSSSSGTLRGLFAVLEGTWGRMSIPTTRYETKGMRAADYESAIWLWRTERLLGTDGVVTDRVASVIGSRRRVGAELHYLLGPLAISSEYLQVGYEDIAVYHDLYVGSKRIVHEQLRSTSGAVRSWSTWASMYLTGESKRITDAGWRTAKPNAAVGSGGPGAWEVLARYTKTWSERGLFAPLLVSGFDAQSPELPGNYAGATPGSANSVSAAVLDGAHDVNELTLGLNWTINPMVRVQVSDVVLWTPFADRDGDGDNDNLFVSGARSAQANPDTYALKTGWENAVMIRLIFKV